jgi:hypothetical protein
MAGQGFPRVVHVGGMEEFGGGGVVIFGTTVEGFSTR